MFAPNVSAAEIAIYLKFLCGIVRGALENIGFKSVVSVRPKVVTTLMYIFVHLSWCIDTILGYSGLSR